MDTAPKTILETKEPANRELIMYIQERLNELVKNSDDGAVLFDFTKLEDSIMAWITDSEEVMAWRKDHDSVRFNARMVMDRDFIRAYGDDTFYAKLRNTKIQHSVMFLIINQLNINVPYRSGTYVSDTYTSLIGRANERMAELLGKKLPPRPGFTRDDAKRVYREWFEPLIYLDTNKIIAEYKQTADNQLAIIANRTDGEHLHNNQLRVNSERLTQSLVLTQVLMAALIQTGMRDEIRTEIENRLEQREAIQSTVAEPELPEDETFKKNCYALRAHALMSNTPIALTAITEQFGVSKETAETMCQRVGLTISTEGMAFFASKTAKTSNPDACYNPLLLTTGDQIPMLTSDETGKKYVKMTIIGVNDGFMYFIVPGQELVSRIAIGNATYPLSLPDGSIIPAPLAY